MVAVAIMMVVVVIGSNIINSVGSGPTFCLSSCCVIGRLRGLLGLEAACSTISSTLEAA